MLLRKKRGICYCSLYLLVYSVSGRVVAASSAVSEGGATTVISSGF